MNTCVAWAATCSVSTAFGAERNFTRLRRAKRRSPCLILDGNKEGFRDDQDVFEALQG